MAIRFIIKIWLVQKSSFILMFFRKFSFFGGIITNFKFRQHGGRTYHVHKMSQILAEILVLSGTVWFRFLSIDLLSGVAWKWKNLLLNLHWSEIDAPKMDTHPHLTPQRPIYEMHVAKSYRSKSNHEKITINSGKLISIDFTLAGNAFLRFNQFRKKCKKRTVIVGVLDRLAELFAWRLC